ncbi:hypothetical protein [Niallia sp. NCCP-28]|uniref:hypothetical protein n=1 Tax=Niallia sp. NCCP-28 TaxID=2934712 RepID=UPI002081ADF4|nr:hypothetical protein [Niallia sp. NCCP-28]GKU83273.1 hypothetical protein NCCP28_26690 [Niallia sp. NCCP-28]
MKLNVLDQSVISNASTARTTLQNKVKLEKRIRKENGKRMIIGTKEKLGERIALFTRTVSNRRSYDSLQSISFGR